MTEAFVEVISKDTVQGNDNRHSNESQSRHQDVHRAITVLVLFFVAPNPEHALSYCSDHLDRR